MHSDLKGLRYFATLAETLSFTAAAAKLQISQPALSLAIQRLEEQLGIPLLARTSRSVVLTTAGESYALGAREVLALMGQVERTAVGVAAGADGTCRLSFVQSATFDVVPLLVKAFQSQAPGIRLQLGEHTSTEQIKLLSEGLIDLGLVRQSVQGSESASQESLKSIAIHEQRLVAAVPSAHALARRTVISLSELEGEPFIMVPDRRSPALSARIRSACAAAGFQPRSSIEVVEMASILAFVAEGLGVALVPGSCRRFLGQEIRLLELDDAIEHLRLPLFLAHRTRERSATIRRAAQIILAASMPSQPIYPEIRAQGN